MKISVVYALPEKQIVLDLDVIAGTTVAEALLQSGIFLSMPDTKQAAVGIYGNITSGDTVLKPGDRIEIYRPLRHEPKDARRRRLRTG